MKYYSELTKEFYDTPKACEQAEKTFKNEQAEIKAELERLAEEKRKTEEATKLSKKEMAKAIQSAEAELTEANKLYEIAKQKAAEILDASNKEASKVLDAAAEKVKEAQKKRYEAVVAFNKKHGTYTTTLTGEKAAEEFNKSMNHLNDMLKFLWRSWF